ncbi:MAG: hypothetical protein IJR52_12000 [Selenomonadaceae bacterium]|nr:hypothetical protein [Selenomonadaceae bacterium]
MLTLDGASYLERGVVELGGRDFQITGRAFEDPNDMAVRRKIFERVILGGSVLHSNAAWKGTIAEFKIFAGAIRDGARDLLRQKSRGHGFARKILSA